MSNFQDQGQLQLWVHTTRVPEVGLIVALFFNLPTYFWLKKKKKSMLGSANQMFNTRLYTGFAQWCNTTDTERFSLASCQQEPIGISHLFLIKKKINVREYKSDV